MMLIASWTLWTPASSTTISWPPWRSRPRVGFLWAGEPGIASRAAPARAATISPRRMRCDRRSATCTAGRLPGRFLRSRLVLRLGLLPGLELSLVLLVLLVGADDAGHGAPRDADVRARRDLDEELVLGDALHVAEEAARGDDLVSDLDVLDQRGLLRLAAPLRPDH